MKTKKRKVNLRKLKSQVNKDYIGTKAIQAKAEARINAKESKAMLLGLSKPFLDTYYVNILTDWCRMVGMNCVQKFTEHLEGSYDQILEEYTKYSVHKEDREQMLRMASREYIKEHLTPEKPYYHFTYRRLLGDTYRWYRMYLILATSKPDGQVENIVVAFMDVHEEKEIINSYKQEKKKDGAEVFRESAPEKKKDGRKPGVIGVILAGIVPLMAICIGVLILFYHSMEMRLYNERLSYLKDCSSNVTQTIESVMAAQWNLSDVLLEFLELERAEDTEALHEQMRRAERLMTYDQVSCMVIDGNGNYYDSEGRSGSWAWLQGENWQAKERSIFVTDSPQQEEQIVFLTKLEKPIAYADGITVTGFALARQLSALQDVFARSGFRGDLNNLIVDYGGTCLYSHSAMFQEGSDVTEALSEGKYLHGASYENWRENLENGIPDSVEIRYQGTDYFVASVPFSNNSWMLLFLVPDASLNTDDQSLLQLVLPYACILALVFMALLTFVVYVFISSRNSHKLQRYQESANKELEKLVEKANAASLAKSEFLTHMSHDIRTPINGIIGMTDIAMKNINNPERVRDCLDKVTSSTGHLLSLVNDVLDMSQIGSGKVQITNVSMDIRVLFDNCNSIIRGQLLNKKIQYDARCENIQHPFVFGDEFHLRQLLLNILDNAVKFTPDGGSITFLAEELGSDGQTANFQFRVQDTGIGMSREFQKHIFEQFSQENAGMRTDYKGTGLGMAITKELTDRMGGTIEVESKLKEGSAFTVLLQFEIDETAELEEKSDEVDLSGMKVLLVEDNELNMEIVKVVLEEEQIVVTCAENGKVALDKFCESALYMYDAILMDVMMPVMDGLEAARAIRGLDREDAKTVPIIAMTANAYAEDAKKVKDAGMDVHLAKPVEPDMLYATLAQYKGSSPAGRNETNVGTGEGHKK